MSISCDRDQIDKVLSVVKEGSAPLYIRPYREKKVWGVDGIGEYWYGAETGEKSSIAGAGEYEAPLDKVLKEVPKELIGPKVIGKFGEMLPLTKILTPMNRLSMQFHDSKNELWVVTGIDASIAEEEPSIVLGFSARAVEKYGGDIAEAYLEALENYGVSLNTLIDTMEKKGYREILEIKKDVIKATEEIKDSDEEIKILLSDLLDASRRLELFYHKQAVRIGDVIPVPSGTLHALGSGIQVLEPQIPGPTQSMEDGPTYPVRYAFPSFKRESATKVLDMDRVREIIPSAATNIMPEVLEQTDCFKIERLPGGFEAKGMEVRRITIKKGSGLRIKNSESAHLLAIVNSEGSAVLIVKEGEYRINKADPGESLILVPASISDFTIQAKENTEIIDTFTPAG